MALSMAAMCHPFIGLKLMSLAGVDPATSGQGQILGKESTTGMPPVVPCYIYGAIYIYIYIYIYICLYMHVVWGTTGPGLSPSPWSHDMLHITHSYIIWTHTHAVVFVPTVISTTRHLAFDHWLMEQDPMLMLVRGRMGHTTLPLTVRG